jgi:hypothetical protein
VSARTAGHIETYVQHACTQPITLHSTQNLLAMGAIGVEWLLFRTGLGATNHFEAGGFIRSRAGVRHPDLQFHFLPIAIAYDGKDKVDQHGFQAHVGPMRPTSRGWVRLASADPRQAPRIQFNYLATEAITANFAPVSGSRGRFSRRGIRPVPRTELAAGGATTDAKSCAPAAQSGAPSIPRHLQDGRGRRSDGSGQWEFGVRNGGPACGRLPVMPAVVAAASICDHDRGKAADLILGKVPLRLRRSGLRSSAVADDAALTGGTTGRSRTGKQYAGNNPKAFPERIPYPASNTPDRPACDATRRSGPCADIVALSPAPVRTPTARTPAARLAWMSSGVSPT